MRMFGMTCLNLSTEISTYEILWGKFMKTINDVSIKLFLTYFQKFSKIAYTKIISVYFILWNRNNLFIRDSIIRECLDWFIWVYLKT